MDTFSFSVERIGGSLKLNCSVSDVFPEPHLHLLRDTETISVTETLSVVNRDSFSVSVHEELNQRHIPDTSLLGCRLNIPGTNFSITEQQVFRKYRQQPRSLPRHSSRANSQTPTMGAIITAVAAIVAIVGRTFDK